jgi:hypothetical protein
VKLKTDRRDARALAEACVLGAYRRAHRLSDAQRHVLARLTVRDALVRTRTGYIAVARSLLRPPRDQLHVREAPLDFRVIGHRPGQGERRLLLDAGRCQIASALGKAQSICAIKGLSRYRKLGRLRVTVVAERPDHFNVNAKIRAT